MNSRRLFFYLPLLAIVTVLASLLTPAPVLAAGEPPPPPGEKSPKAPSAAPAKPAPPASPTGASYTAEMSVEAPAVSPSWVVITSPVALSVDAIAQAGAVLVGPSGNPLPLAARDTLTVLATDDVYFKGSGAGCSGGWCKYDTLTEALAAFPSHNGSGTIYATGALSESGAVTVDGAKLNLSKLTGLAWDGTTNTIPQLSGGLLTIANLLKGFIVDGFSVLQGIYAHDNTGTLRLQNLYVTNPASQGIRVANHKGNIDLFNVIVYQAGNEGAWLDNTAGAGNVTISNSSFNGNLTFGVRIETGGSALLDRVEANGNQMHNGAYLQVKKGATVKDSRFNDNLNASGLGVSYGQGALNLQNVEARGNINCGIYLSTANDVSVNGAFLADNSGCGLGISSSGGNITLNNLQSLGNAEGVRIDNSASVSVKAVTVNNSRFNGSTAGDGLQVLSKGNITLNHIDAEGNAGNGVSIDNAIYDGGSHIYKGSGSVSLLNSLGLNQFISNANQALIVASKGAITVKGVYADANAGGLNIDGCAADPNPPLKCLGKGNVTVSAVTIGNTSANNGLFVLAGGAISLDGSRFISNKDEVTLDNSPAAAGKPVTVTNSSFYNTSDPLSVGLSVYSKGSITLNNVQANANQGKLTPDTAGEDISGILLDNCLYDVPSNKCTGSGSVSVLSSLGPSQASGNTRGVGLFIFSKGAVVISGFSSTFNATGTLINNSLGAGTLTITNSTFSNNIGANGGLKAYSTSAITLNGVEASSNSAGRGIYVSSQNGAIAVSKSRFDHNKNWGLDAIAGGNLIVNNVSASYNNGTSTSFGAYLNSFNGGVTILNTLGPNLFSHNARYGLSVISYSGAISVSGATVSYNSAGSGLLLDNSSTDAPKTVTAQKILVEHNAIHGLSVKSKGSVTLNNVQANFNLGGYGVLVDNCLLPIPCEGSGNVSILSTLGPNRISNNLYGLWIETAGSVLVNGVTANDNSSAVNNISGAGIENFHTPGKTVTVNQSSFNSNHGLGLRVDSAGVITLNNIAAGYNLGGAGYGVFLSNPGAAGSPGVNILSTLGDNQFNGNAGFGLYVVSSGSLTLSKVIASDNGVPNNSSGAYLETGGTSSISITCSAFNHNQNYGLEVVMGSGKLAFKSVAAGGNFGPTGFSLSKAPVMSWTVCGH